MFEDNTDFDIDSKSLDQECPVKTPLVFLPDDSKIILKPPKIPTEKNVVPRKFPGPAGLLPNRKHKSFSATRDEPLKKSCLGVDDFISCSQDSSAILQEKLWGKMLNDFGPHPYRYNIKWIKHNTRGENLQKVPFLGAMIQSIDRPESNDRVVNITLKDHTGEVQGTISNKLFLKYPEGLTIGSVIVLKEFSVLKTRLNNPHLTITSKNLVAIYYRNEAGETVVEKLQDSTNAVETRDHTLAECDVENQGLQTCKATLRPNPDLVDDLVLLEIFSQDF